MLPGATGELDGQTHYRTRRNWVHPLNSKREKEHLFNRFYEI
jgi:hypothetical protein